LDQFGLSYNGTEWRLPLLPPRATSARVCCTASYLSLDKRKISDGRHISM